MENYGKLCTEFEQIEADAFSTFKGEVRDLTKDKITAACANINKASVIQWLGIFVEMYQGTKRFCSSATNKVEVLTSQVMEGQEKLIALQGDLLAAKDEQLAHVRTAVKEEIASVQSVVETDLRSSWSDIVANGSSASQPFTTEAKLKQALKSAVAEEDRSRNLMIFGKAETAGEENVFESVAEILQDIHEKPRIVECYRIGTVAEGKQRPIKVKLSGSDAVYNVLRSAKHLKDSRSNSSAYIGPDRSKEERIEHRKLVVKMKKMMEEDKDKYHFIRSGGITSVKKKEAITRHEH